MYVAGEIFSSNGGGNVVNLRQPQELTSETLTDRQRKNDWMIAAGLVHLDGMSLRHEAVAFFDSAQGAEDSMMPGSEDARRDWDYAMAGGAFMRDLVAMEGVESFQDELAA